MEEYTKIEISLAGSLWRMVDLQGNELETDSITLKERPVYFVSEGKGLKGLPWEEQTNHE